MLLIYLFPFHSHAGLFGGGTKYASIIGIAPSLRRYSSDTANSFSSARGLSIQLALGKQNIEDMYPGPGMIYVNIDYPLTPLEITGSDMNWWGSPGRNIDGFNLDIVYETGFRLSNRIMPSVFVGYSLVDISNSYDESQYLAGTGPCAGLGVNTFITDTVSIYYRFSASIINFISTPAGAGFTATSLSHHAGIKIYTYFKPIDMLLDALFSIFTSELSDYDDDSNVKKPKKEKKPKKDKKPKKEKKPKKAKKEKKDKK